MMLMLMLMMGLACYDYWGTRSSCFEQKRNDDIGGDDWTLVKMRRGKGENKIGQ
jgi:hypothetical protein